AQKELIVVQHDGLGAFAAVGTGIIALRQKRWDDAVRPFEEARDAGTPDIVAAAEYGLAVARFAKGAVRDFRKPAEAALAAHPRLAEGLLETGKLADARREVDKTLAEKADDARATLILARVREASGDRAGALEAYSRAARASQGPEWSTPALLGHARLLVQDQRWDQARTLGERLLKSDDTAVSAEAAQIAGD